MSKPIASRHNPGSNSRQVAFGGTTSIPVRVKVEWGKHPQHLTRFVTVTVGGFSVLRKPFPEAREEAETVLQAVLGGRDESLLADLRRALAEVKL